ncbi:MAG: hypothetical protein V9G24_16185 [Rhodoblastus sp.]
MTIDKLEQKFYYRQHVSIRKDKPLCRPHFKLNTSPAHFTPCSMKPLHNVHGFYRDRGTSLFETLATISAEEASIAVGGKCATVAAQVKHIAFYLDVLEEAVRTQQFERQDLGQDLARDKRCGARGVGVDQKLPCGRAMSASRR